MSAMKAIILLLMFLAGVLFNHADNRNDAVAGTSSIGLLMCGVALMIWYLP